jgi:hypothetical protein
VRSDHNREPLSRILTLNTRVSESQRCLKWHTKV